MKLIFLDIDGTILSPGKSVSPATLAAIAAARAKGNRVFLSTGRTPTSLPEQIDPADFDGGIFSAGAVVKLGRETLLDRPMSKQLLTQITEALEALDLYYHYETEDGAFACDRPMMPLTEAELARASSEVRRVLELFSRFPRKSLADYRGQPVYKVSFRAKTVDQAEALRRSLGESANVVSFANLTGDLPFTSGEINDAAINKGEAMDLLCRRLNCGRSDCVAFGDSMNDLEIIRSAGTGVAMGNAEPGVKAAADLICESCDEDGVAKELKRMGLT